MVFSVSDAVSAYSKAGNLPSVSGIAKGGQAGGFDDMLKSMVDDTVDSLQAGEKATLMAAQGKGNMADVVLAVNNAESLLTTVVSIRDRVIGAYQEIMRTGV